MTPVSPRARLAAVALLTAIATTAFADPTVPALRPAPWKPPVTASRPQPFLPGVAGMIVALDPESGEMGLPTARQAEALMRSEENMLSRSTEGLQVQYLPSGAVMLDLQGRFQEFSVARIGADGRIVFDCLSDLNAVRSTLRAPLPRPAVWEDR
ncbi:MAG: hypothetical protein HZA61_14070 [Candidatus Eisenbacteria bacterium]|uniref:Uncharacterized protein n=1 Tax=Eiseniibacteriota bacterium TaxID=2212470 RepID=A0A933SDL9_UNCEI|nr:hypothetical protein [Candidatus Eisenbacteria bacterium]